MFFAVQSFSVVFSALLFTVRRLFDSKHVYAVGDLFFIWWVSHIVVEGRSFNICGISGRWDPPTCFSCVVIVVPSVVTWRGFRGVGCGVSLFLLVLSGILFFMLYMEF